MFAVFLRYKMSKVQKGINADELCYPISQFLWASANWYCIFSNFHFVLMYHTLYFPLCFHPVISMYPLIIRTRKQTVFEIKRLFFVS